MNLVKDKYVIVEIIPTSLNKEKGQIVELTALKIDGLKLVDRFNYRLKKENVLLKDFLDMCNYDNGEFIYLEESSAILDKFKEFIEDYPLLLIDNTYTLNYLDEIENKKELIFPYLDLEFTDYVMETIVNKYKLEASNYMVDLVYEAIIRHF